MANWESAPVASSGSWEQAPADPDYIINRASGTIELSPTGTMKDWAKSLGSGLVTGAEATVGFPQDMLDLAQAGADKATDVVSDRLFGPKTKAQSETIDELRQNRLKLMPSSQNVAGAVHDVTGFVPHEPETTGGKYLRTVGSFAPMAALGPGRLVGNVAKYAVVPGVASEAAGEATKGSAYEMPARVAGAVIGGGASALFSRPSTPALALRSRLPKGATDADVSAAESLIKQANSRGINLTWPEALAKATNGRVDITDVQRVLEQMESSRPIMTDFLHERPKQMGAAFDRAMDELSAGVALTDPVKAGLSIRQASADALTKVRQRINATTDALYNSAGSQTIAPMEFYALSRDPLFKDALAAVRNDPVYAKAVQGFPDLSVQVLDQVKKRLDDLAGSARTAGENYAAGRYGSLASDVKGAAVKASPDYGKALQRQAQLRKSILEPAEEGPIGKMSATPDLQAQGNAVLKAKPSEGSEHVVSQTVRRLARQDAPSAFQLVRDHLATAFNESAQATRAGSNQWGAANFAAAVRGNRQQALNLKAAIEALPGGKTRWQGLNELFNIMETSGKRQAMGSPTEANRLLTESLKKGTIPGEATSLSMAPGSLMTRAKQAYDQFRMSKNAEGLARLITDPQAAPMFRRLLSARGPGEKERAATLLVYYLTHAERTKKESP